jgi:hypothetical protein
MAEHKDSLRASLLMPLETQPHVRQTVVVEEDGKGQAVVELQRRKSARRALFPLGGEEAFLDEYADVQNEEEEDHDHGLLLSSTTAATTTHSIWTIYYESLLFFACGMGSSLCYIATLSALVFFRMHYGPNVYVYLNLAVYVPLLPISLIQARYDQDYDQRYQSQKAFFCRGMVGFALSVIGTLLVATMTIDLSSNKKGMAVTQLLMAAVLQGTGGAILVGSLNQMVSFVRETTLVPTMSQRTTPTSANDVTSGGGGRRLKASLSAGVQASALLVLIVSILTGFVGHGQDQGNDESDNDESSRHLVSLGPFGRFFYTIVGLECTMWGFFIALMYCHPPVAKSMKRRDQSMQLSSSSGDRYNTTMNLADNDAMLQALSSRNATTMAIAMTGPEEESLSPYNMVTGADQPENLALFDASAPLLGTGLAPPLPHSDRTSDDLWDSTKSCCVTLVVTLIPSFLVGTWFTHVETNWMALPQILFYVRIGSDLLGRISTIWIPPPSVQCLTYTALLRYIPVAVFFINATSPLAPLPHREVNRGDDDEDTPTSSDYISIGLVALIAFFSGYVVTGCFQLAPTLLGASSSPRREARNEQEVDPASPVELTGRHENANVAKQASLLNIAFSVAALCGLVSSFILIGLGL